MHSSVRCSGAKRDTHARPRTGMVDGAQVDGYYKLQYSRRVGIQLRSEAATSYDPRATLSIHKSHAHTANKSGPLFRMGTPYIRI